MTKTIISNEKFTMSVNNFTISVRDNKKNVLVAFSDIEDEYDDSLSEFIEDYFSNAKYII